MDNWSYYLILLLVGIILGGYVTVRTLNNFPTHPINPTTYPPQNTIPAIPYPSNTIISPFLFALISTFFLIIYLAINSNKSPRINQSPTSAKTLLATNYTPVPYDNKLHYETNLVAMSTPAMPALPTFFIQLAAFQEETNALKQLADWENQLAVSAQLVYEEDEVIPWKIWAGPFESTKAARAYLQKAHLTGFILESDKP